VLSNGYSLLRSIDSQPAAHYASLDALAGSESRCRQRRRHACRFGSVAEMHETVTEQMRRFARLTIAS
jgi:hypothetical protein